jgi:hypothetical protein
MKLNHRAEIGLFITSIFTLFLIYISIYSFTIFMKYSIEESVSFPIYLTIYLPFFFYALILFILINLKNAYLVSKISCSPQSLRALYISIFYPILLGSFMMATFRDGFQTSTIYGFPLFTLGVILLPYSALTIHREAKTIINENTSVIYCSYCSYPFDMHKLDSERRCPICGTLNPNKDEKPEAEEKDVKEEN